MLRQHAPVNIHAYLRSTWHDALKPWAAQSRIATTNIADSSPAVQLAVALICVKTDNAAAMQALMQQHEKAFADMKGYFNGVVRDNLDAIMALKAELAEHKRREASTQSLLQEVVAENKRLSEPLDKVIFTCQLASAAAAACWSVVDSLRHQSLVQCQCRLLCCLDATA